MLIISPISKNSSKLYCDTGRVVGVQFIPSPSSLKFSRVKFHQSLRSCPIALGLKAKFGCFSEKKAYFIISHKVILLSLLQLAFLNALQTQELVSSTYLGSISQAEVQAEYGNQMQFGVEMHKIVYETTSLTGQVNTASGLIVLPKLEGQSSTFAFPVLSYQNPPGINNEDAPSNLLADWEKATFWAGQGYVTLCPDYLGYGESRSAHPYLHAASAATSLADFLRASVSFCAQESTLELNGQLFLTGYQEGGHYSIALHRKIEQELSEEFEVTASAPVSAPYDLSGLLLERLSQDSNYLYPAVLPQLLLAYLGQGADSITVSDNVFNTPYLDPINEFHRGERDIIASNLCDIELIYADTGQNDYNMVPNALMNDDTIWMVWRTGPSHNGQADTINGGIRLAKFHKGDNSIRDIEVVRTDIAEANIDTLAIDPVIGDLQDGRVVIFYTKRAQVGVPRWAEVWFKIRYPDGSYSSEKKVVGPYMPEMDKGWMVAGSFQLDDSDNWMLSIYGYNEALAGAHNRTNYNCELLRSNDEGNTWTHLAQLGNGEADGLQYEEPQIKKLSDGRWAALIRRDDTGTISVSYSAPNDPTNWTQPTQKFNGIARPCFVQTNSGEIVVSTRNHVNSLFNTTKFQSEAVYYVSKDVGETWIGPMSIAPNEEGFYMYGCPIEDEADILFIWSYANSDDSTASLYKKTINRQFLESRSFNQKLIELLSNTPTLGILSDSLVERIQSVPNHPLVNYLYSNSVYNWTPSAPTRLFYCDNDKFSPEHSLKADSVMNTNGAPNTMAQEIGAAQGLCDCKSEYLYQVSEFFDAYKVITGTPEFADEKAPQIYVYPNPAFSNLNIKGLKNDAEVLVYNSIGQLLKQVHLYNNEHTISVAGLPNGSYFLMIKMNDQVITQKVIIGR